MLQQFISVAPLIAIIISILAFSVSLANLYWNIYRELSLRARMSVQFGYRQIYHQNRKEIDITLIGGNNLGPGKLIVSNIIWKSTGFWKWLFRRSLFGIILPDPSQPYTDTLPKKIDQSEGISLILPFPYDLDEHVTHVGLADTYGRYHWASTTDVKAYRTACRKFKDNTDRTIPCS